MSYTNCCFCGYAIILQNNDKLREEFNACMANPDLWGVKDYVETGRVDSLPEKGGLFTKEYAPTIIYGPDSLVYIGYEAAMPYETPKMTKEQMDKKLYDVQLYLYGKEKKDKFVAPTINYDIWSE